MAPCTNERGRVPHNRALGTRGRPGANADATGSHGRPLGLRLESRELSLSETPPRVSNGGASRQRICMEERRSRLRNLLCAAVPCPVSHPEGTTLFHTWRLNSHQSCAAPSRTRLASTRGGCWHRVSTAIGRRELLLALSPLCGRDMPSRRSRAWRRHAQSLLGLQKQVLASSNSNIQGHM
jgi:hypothetical protein